MKIREGYVSNSSSTAFILDYSNPKTKEWVQRNRSFVGRAVSTGRQTALSVGRDAVDYARKWNSAMSRYGDMNFGDWILEWAIAVGEENLVFARESDEGMGGEFLTQIPKGCILEEMEYH